MDTIWASSEIMGIEAQGLFLIASTVILLIIIFFLYKTYRTSMNVEARLSEFSSLTHDTFGRRLRLIEVNADEHKLNKQALGPLGRIIDEYCVLTTNRDGVITFANGKFLSLSGFSFQQLIGKPETVNHPAADKLPSGAGVMQCARALSGVWNGEVCNRRADGSVYWMNMFLFPLSYISDEDDGYIYFGTDITDIKAENSELQQAVMDKDQKLNEVESLLLHSEKMASLGTISAGIAHEINNPIAFLSSNINRCKEYLGALSGVIRGLEKRITPEKFDRFLAIEGGDVPERKKLDFILEDQESLVNETMEGIDRIKKIIRDLKHFSHNQPDKFSSIDLVECIDASLNLAHHELKNRITVKRDIPENLPPLQGSESQLSQVFMNLFVNTAQAIQGKGEIHIDVTCDDNWFTLSIADDGPGIPGDKIDQIFEPFFTTKPIGQGTGLGLSISHDIIQQHGGSMSVSSHLGEGTTFTIQLPRRQRGEAHAA